MIILDTNVLSELMKPEPDLRVSRWVALQPAVSLFTTTITQAEVLYGVALLPEGKRRDGLAEAVETMFEEDFAGRILDFDSAAAAAYPQVVLARRLAGRPIAQLDAEIAAIAVSRGAAVATRNISDFEGAGVELYNPWGN